MQTCWRRTRHPSERHSLWNEAPNFRGCSACWGGLGRTPGWGMSPYLFCKPAEVPDLPAPSKARQAQLLPDLGDHAGHQVTDGRMDGAEPGLGRGRVLAPQDHCVLSIWRVDFKLPRGAEREGLGGSLADCVTSSPELQRWTNFFFLSYILFYFFFSFLIKGFFGVGFVCFFFFLLDSPWSMWDLSSLTRDWTGVPYSGSTES